MQPLIRSAGARHPPRITRGRGARQCGRGRARRVSARRRMPKLHLVRGEIPRARAGDGPGRDPRNDVTSRRPAAVRDRLRTRCTASDISPSMVSTRVRANKDSPGKLKATRRQKHRRLPNTYTAWIRPRTVRPSPFHGERTISSSGTSASSGWTASTKESCRCRASCTRFSARRSVRSSPVLGGQDTKTENGRDGSLQLTSRFRSEARSTCTERHMPATLPSRGGTTPMRSRAFSNVSRSSISSTSAAVANRSPRSRHLRTSTAGNSSTFTPPSSTDPATGNECRMQGSRPARYREVE